MTAAAENGIVLPAVKPEWRQCLGMSPRTNLVGKTLEELATLMAGMGEPHYRARQLYASIYRRRLTEWDRFTDLSLAFRERLRQDHVLAYPEPDAVFISEDGTRRYLLAVEHGHRIEAVYIPESERDTICISTQVGCAVECLFCVTGRLPLRRNLDAGEIVGQVLALQADRKLSRRRLNIVIMGMGEPLNNYDNVMKALRLLTDPQGMALPPRRITLSTAGVVPQLQRLAQEPVVPNLAVSLSATTDEVRDLLIPINRKWKIPALLEACRSFPLHRRRRITFEYVLIAGVNDSEDDARRLVLLLRGLRKKVNLIPLNADPWVPLQPPEEPVILAFQKILTGCGVTAHIRNPRGNDISAACGMLAARGTPRGEGGQPPPKPASDEAVSALTGRSGYRQAVERSVTAPIIRPDRSPSAR